MFWLPDGVAPQFEFLCPEPRKFLYAERTPLSIAGVKKSLDLSATSARGEYFLVPTSDEVQDLVAARYADEL